MEIWFLPYYISVIQILQIKFMPASSMKKYVCSGCRRHYSSDWQPLLPVSIFAFLSRKNQEYSWCTCLLYAHFTGLTQTLVLVEGDHL